MRMFAEFCNSLFIKCLYIELHILRVLSNTLKEKSLSLTGFNVKDIQPIWPSGQNISISPHLVTHWWSAEDSAVSLLAASNVSKDGKKCFFFFSFYRSLMQTTWKQSHSRNMLTTMSKFPFFIWKCARKACIYGTFFSSLHLQELEMWNSTLSF